MALTDPKSGVGYLAGERLLSAHVNTVFAQQPRALDAVDGGTYDVGNDIVLNDDGGSLQFGDGLGVAFNGTTNLPALGSRTYSRVQPLVINYRTVGGGGAGVADWIYSAAAGYEGALQHQYAYTTADEAFFYLPIANLIDRSTLTQITLSVDPPTHTTTPGRKIRAGLYRLRPEGTVLVGSIVEDPANWPGYDAPHYFVLSGYSEAINETTSATTYLLKILGEGGSDAFPGTIIRYCAASFTVTALTPGG
jgi:hypothetical protein